MTEWYSELFRTGGGEPIHTGDRNLLREDGREPIHTGDRNLLRESGRKPLHTGNRTYSARAARTSSTWPSTFTFRKTWVIFPFPSMMKVERSTPMYLRPYMLFSFQTP